MASASISGRVVDYDSDQPIQGVLVQGILSNGIFINSTNTDASGNFTLTDQGLADPSAKVTFTADGYATQSMRPASADGVDVVLPKANTLSSVTLTIKRSPVKAIIFVLIGAAVVYFLIKYKNQIKL
jgi:hypothetical protein